MKPIIIINCEYGQLGNRLHTHSNILAFCIEYNLNLINFSFSKYKDLFNNKLPHLYIHKTSEKIFFNSFILKFIFFILNINSINRILDYFTLKKGITETINQDELLIFSKKKRIFLIINSWDIQCNSLVNKHKFKLLHHLEPIKLKEIKREFNILYTKCKLVGVHIRQTDYKEWLNGKYFFDLKDYIKLIEYIHNYMLKRNVYINFIICSDVSLKREDFKRLPVSISNSNLIDDISKLSLCKCIIGPPSSFSSWASFIGDCRKVNLNENFKSNLNQKLLNEIDSCL